MTTSGSMLNALRYSRQQALLEKEIKKTNCEHVMQALAECSNGDSLLGSHVKNLKSGVFVGDCEKLVSLASQDSVLFTEQNDKINNVIFVIPKKFVPSIKITNNTSFRKLDSNHILCENFEL
jgi:hypothetical protein